MGQTKADVSIIIRTYNEEKHLDKCLSRVGLQETSHTKEVLIIDSESTDRTLSIAKKHKAKILKISRNEFTYGRALNQACKAAKGNILVFLSAHALPKDDSWLEKLTKPLQSGFHASFGSQKPHQSADPLIKRLVGETWKPEIILKNTERLWMKYNNTNSATLKEVWQEHAFDDRALSGEDAKWAKKLQETGYKIKYVDSALVYHSHNDSLGDLYMRYLNDARATITLAGMRESLVLSRDLLHNIHDDYKYLYKGRYPLKWYLRSLQISAIKAFAIAHAALTKQNANL